MGNANFVVGMIIIKMASIIQVKKKHLKM